MLGVALSATDPRVQQLVSMAYPAVAQFGVIMPYGRKQESEADQIGLHYMARAGYDPAEAVNFWTRFSDFNRQTGAKSGPAFLRTHPVDEVREIVQHRRVVLHYVKDPRICLARRGELAGAELNLC